MAIKRYYATADTTITNAYAEDLKTRATNSNMGKADTLEVFTLFDQVETSTKTKDGRISILPHRESARILLKFDTSSILSDTTIPAGSKYFLRLFNAVHPHTLPDNFSLELYALDESFDEGYGKDADNYTDRGLRGQSAAASWSDRKYDSHPLSNPATGTLVIDVNPTSTITVVIGGHSISVEPNVAGAQQTAADIATALTASGTDISLLVNAQANLSVNGQIDLTALNIGGDKITIDISSDSGNLLRNSSNWTAIGSGGSNGAARLTGGSDTVSWTNSGGTYGTATPTPIGSYELVDGSEDVVIDITSYINSLDASEYSDAGLILKLGQSEEAATRSFYTKKFFARSSEYFFLRPCIEVRWDSSTFDNRSNFYAQHPLRTVPQNTHKIYFKNYVNGELAAPSQAPASLVVYATSAKETQLDQFVVENPSTGVYSASVILDTQLEDVYLEWVDGATLFHSETLEVKQVEPSTTNTVQEYVVSITNMKKSYLGRDPEGDRTTEKARFRLYVRPKNWCPNVYTKVQAEVQNYVIENIYYKVFRVADEFVIFDYGVEDTGHTKLSYDGDGNYFDFDMSMLEKGYSYGIQFMTVVNGEYREQPEVFKFRVE